MLRQDNRLRPVFLLIVDNLLASCGLPVDKAVLVFWGGGYAQVTDSLPTRARIAESQLRRAVWGLSTEKAAANKNNLKECLFYNYRLGVCA